MTELENLKTEVRENKEVMTSAVTLLNGLSAFIRDNLGNPAALQELATELDTNSKALAAAVVANTPSEPPVTEPPTEPPTPA